MTDPMLFDGFPDPDPAPTPDPSLSAGQRLTIRQRDSIALGIHPLNGRPILTTGETCGTCVHREVWAWHNKTYPHVSWARKSAVRSVRARPLTKSPATTKAATGSRGPTAG